MTSDDVEAQQYAVEAETPAKVCGDTLHTANDVYECTLTAPHFGDRHYDAPKGFSW